MENISATAQNRRALQITFALTLSYFIVEVVGGILTSTYYSLTMNLLYPIPGVAPAGEHSCSTPPHCRVLW